MKAEQKNTITKWEVGNVLVKVADELSSAICDLETNGWSDSDESKMLLNLRDRVARHFNAEFQDEMGFGL